MFLLIAFFLLAIIVSFLCSLLESALLSTPASFAQAYKQEAIAEGKAAGAGRSPAHLARHARRKIETALLLQRFKTETDRPLSAILALNTVANTVGAAGVGAQGAVVFGDTYLGIISGVLTLTILVFSEILPKTIGSRFWRKVAPKAVRTILVMTWICYPLVYLSKAISWLITRKQTEEPSVSREEVSALVNIGSQEGVFEDDETRRIKSILALEELRTKDIMTPRTVAVTASEEMTLREFFRQKNYLKYSRIPIYENDNPEVITGWVLLKHVFELLAEDRFDTRLKEIRRPVLWTFEQQKVSILWDEMQETSPDGRKIVRSAQMAVVLDEYGSFAGLVTVEDIVEAMLGQEITDEKDTVADLQDYARSKYARIKQARSKLTLK
ncbi:MAG: CNNM domain-containing protein [Bacteroidales bacterium]|jgi:CBS domain containing-hemolysin-like protein|nr:CNNM domain-containing protein [Bacteroidales bacterium]